MDSTTNRRGVLPDSAYRSIIEVLIGNFKQADGLPTFLGFRLEVGGAVMGKLLEVRICETR
jgi:hypothetical protein